jgi:serine/threonine protein phosphatase PrpC
MSNEIKFKFAELTDVGLVRQANEDAAGSKEFIWGNVFVLCDGMGGHRGGATAAAIAVKGVLELIQSDPRENIGEAIERSILFANEQIYASAAADPGLKGMGTTCNVVAIKGTEIWAGHVGDSRVYIWTDGELYRITRDHSFVQGLVDQGVIDEEQAEEHPRKNELLRALGVRAEVEVEICANAILPKAGDLIISCSDGLHGMTGEKGLIEELKKGGNIDELAQRLINAAKREGGADNITVQLLEIVESPHKSSRFDPIKVRTDLKKTRQLDGNYPPQSVPQPSSLARYKYPLLIGAIAILILVFWTMRQPGEVQNKEKKGDSASTTIQPEPKSTIDTTAKDTSEVKAVRNDVAPPR